MSEEPLSGTPVYRNRVITQLADHVRASAESLAALARELDRDDVPKLQIDGEAMARVLDRTRGLATVEAQTRLLVDWTQRTLNALGLADDPHARALMAEMYAALADGKPPPAEDSTG